MTDFQADNTFVDGASITAAGHNQNWDDIEAFLNTVGVHVYQANTITQAAFQDNVVGEEEITTTLAEAIGATEASTPRRDYVEALAEVTATDTGSLEDEGGPSITLTVPSGGLVELFVAADLKHSTGGASYARVGLIRDGVVSIFQNLISSNSTSYETKYTAPEQTLGEPLGENFTGGWLVFPDTAGSHTYSLRYGISGTGTGTFRNRKIWGRVVGGF